MIGRFAKNPDETNLAELAILFPLISGISLLGVVAIIAIMDVFWPAKPTWVASIPLVVCLLWITWLWIFIVQSIRTSRIRHTSPNVFTVLQFCAIGFMILEMILRLNYDQQFFSVWVMLLDLFLLVFYINFFLFALFSWTKVPLSAVTGFIVVCLSLCYEAFHNPFHT